jgi:hypothetical protein
MNQEWIGFAVVTLGTHSSFFITIQPPMLGS